MPASVAVAVEVGTRRCFASALDWPGWARSGRDPTQALETLEAYRIRYSAVLERAALAAPTGRLVVKATVPGSATTDFGAPGAIVDADHRRLTRADRERLVAILDASWAAFNTATTRRVELRVGPRGGGRSFEKLSLHVTDAEVSYARALGLRVSATDGDATRIAQQRDDVRGVVLAERETDREPTAPLRYVVRRIAWHVVDHLFELEDRTLTNRSLDATT
jgi:hypothetical protein